MFWIYAIFLGVTFGSCIIGSICGIGGGVLIKPALDAFGVLDVATISFLSGCTVLVMTSYSVIKSKTSGKSVIDTATSTPLAIGAALGGLLGKSLYQWVASLFADPNTAGAVQAVILALVTVGTLVYTINKSKIKTLHIGGWAICLTIGFLLGVMSSFLGIGGGPMNLVVLYYFFSMPTKIAAQNSLYIVLFSQLASFIQTLITGLPEFSWPLLLGMILMGLLGGMCGRAINKRIDEKVVDKLFILLMIVIILINVYNVFKYLA